MPQLNDIVEVAQALESKAVYVVENRCVAVRNRNVHCHKCQQACLVDAISISNNSLELNHKVCVACGACTTVCPTEALLSLRPLDEDLASHVARACIHNEGTAIFACARIASKGLADSEIFAEVPCLARMEESILLELVAQGIEDILFVDGVCATCKYGFCSEGIDTTIASANTLLSSVGSKVKVKRQSAFPPHLLVSQATGHYGVSRRDFISQSGGTAKRAAVKTVSTMMKPSQSLKPLTIRQRLNITKEGALPQIDPRRHKQVLDALDRIGDPQVEQIETRLWGKVVVDVSNCDGCEMCAIFCPTSALKSVEIGEGKTKGKALEFTLMECVQCMACQDVCVKQNLKVESVIPLAQLFSFEPETIPLPKPPKVSLLQAVKSP